MNGRTAPVLQLGVTQVISWGILYYAFGVMAPQIGADLHLSPAWLYGAFSWAVLVAGLAALPVGALIDRHGGSRVMAAGSLVAAAGLCVLARSDGAGSYYLAWSIIGLGMAMSLYEAAFATLNRSLREASRSAISNVTLLGGLASTVFWPLTAWLLGRLDWRGICLVFALALLAVCLPLHAMLDDGNGRAALASHKMKEKDFSLAQSVAHPVFWLLAGVFAMHAFIFSALSVHLIPLIRKFGQPEQLVVGLAAFIGPMQVLGRLIERMLAGHVTPQVVGVFTVGGLPAALAVLYLAGTSAGGVILFCALYGMSNGVLTILRGTLPQAIFGHTHYGAIAGALAAPSLIAKSAAPLLMALLLTDTDYHFLLGGLLAMSAASFLLYVLALRRQQPDRAARLRRPFASP
jgi:predicted MFS family arabinose efflux permease